MKKQLTFLLAIALLLSACNGTIKDVPAGYVGKILTTNGWDSKIYKSGQVDLGKETNDGRKSKLILLESTSITIKEQFLGKEENSDKTDHRVMTKDGTPISMDIYLLVGIPNDDPTYNSVFTLITPTKDTNSGLDDVITIQSIYDRLVKLAIRGQVREIVARYTNTDSLRSNSDKVNAEIFSRVISIQKLSKAPFEIISASISNIKEDETILQSKNELISTANKVQSINMIGKAIRENPEFLKQRKWDVIEKVGMANQNMILMDIGDKGNISIPVSKQ